MTTPYQEYVDLVKNILSSEQEIAQDRFIKRLLYEVENIDYSSALMTALKEGYMGIEIVHSPRLNDIRKNNKVMHKILNSMFDKLVEHNLCRNSSDEVRQSFITGHGHEDDILFRWLSNNNGSMVTKLRLVLNTPYYTDKTSLIIHKSLPSNKTFYTETLI